MQGIISRAWLAGLAVMAAAGAAGAEGSGPTEIVIDGSTTVGPIAKAFAEYYMKEHPGVSITISESGSGNGAKSLINGVCQIAAMSRFMHDTEVKAAVEKQILPVPHAVAIDGIALVVHPGNPVKDLKLEQIRDIYAGRITNWSQVGGPNTKIVVIGRESNSGTFESFQLLVMKGEKTGPSVESVGSNGAIRQRVQSTPAAIGYVGLGFVDRTVKPLMVNGVSCERQAVMTGRYPVCRPLFLFTSGYPELGSHLHALVTLHLHKKGQEIVEALGYVPLTDY